MKIGLRNNGFSLTEVLLAVGILAVGMMFIAGLFPVAIHFVQLSTDQSIAGAVADEAIAKMLLYSKDAGGIAIVHMDNDRAQDTFDKCSLAWNPQTEQKPYRAVLDYGRQHKLTGNVMTPPPGDIDIREFEYPSTEDANAKPYCWSILCRRVEPYISTNVPRSNLLQVTVFVSRITGGDQPVPYAVGVQSVGGLPTNKLSIVNQNYKTLFYDGCYIVDDVTGGLYRVVQRYPQQDNVILLDRNWVGQNPVRVWVMGAPPLGNIQPPPIGPGTPPLTGGRNPVIGVYQKEIIYPN